MVSAKDRARAIADVAYGHSSSATQAVNRAVDDLVPLPDGRPWTPHAHTAVRALARALLRGGVARPHLAKLAAAGMHLEVALEGRKGKSMPRHLCDSIGLAHTVAMTLLSLKRMADGSKHPSNESVGGAVAPRRRWGLLRAIAVDTGASEGMTDHSTASVDGLLTKAMTTVQRLMANRAGDRRFESLLHRGSLASYSKRPVKG